MVKNEIKLIWSDSEDLALASIVLDAIREGGTQTKAFEQASMKIGRTVTACGFRWNNHLRKLNLEVIKQAKNTAKEPKTNESKSNKTTITKSKTRRIASYKSDDFSDPISVINTSVDLIRDKLIGMSTYILDLESLLAKRDKEISELQKDLVKYKYYSEDIPLLHQLFKKAQEIGFIDRIS
jgi:RsfA family transcription factor